jgi:hypothetical protein
MRSVEFEEKRFARFQDPELSFASLLPDVDFVNSRLS